MSLLGENYGRNVTVKDDNIYIAGGRTYSPTEYSDIIQVFNTDTNTITNYTSSLPTGIVDPQLFFNGDILYVVGGVNYDGYSDKVYALENGAWVEKSSMPYVSEYMRGKYYKDNFYCAAVNSSGNVDILKYNALEDRWETLYEDAILNCSYYGIEILNGMIYVIGGYSDSEDLIRSDIYSFDIATDISSIDLTIPIRTIGFEYEQTVNDDIINPPEILGVNAKVIDREKGIYELYITEDDYKCDIRSTPFFFWSAREGKFVAMSDDYKHVKFYADPGTGDRQIKIVVSIGDGRGYVDKKAFLLDGNNQME